MVLPFAADLPPMDVAGRLPRLREAIAEAECDALLVTSLTTIRSLTGFTGSAGLLLVGLDGCVFATDGRYLTQSAEQLALAGVAVTFAVGRVDAQRRDIAAAAAGMTRMGLEAEDVTWARQL